jgi:hypothetical protein
MKIKITSWIAALAILCVASTYARADEVTDWNQIMLKAEISSRPPTSPVVVTRVAAIVQTSVFDVVNGIEERYTDVHMRPNAPNGASRRAAAVQAAYASLAWLYSSQIVCFDAKCVYAFWPPAMAIPHDDNDQKQKSLERSRRDFCRGGWNTSMPSVITGQRPAAEAPFQSRSNDNREVV